MIVARQRARRMGRGAWLPGLAFMMGCAACSAGAGSSPNDAGADAKASGPEDGAGGSVDGAPDARTAPSSGCVGGMGLPEGERMVMLGGEARRYVLRLPAGYARERAWPLVLALHANGANAGFWDDDVSPQALRNLLRDRTVLVLAEARMGDWMADLPADLAYFDAVIGELEQQLCIDTGRIFALGFSGGGSFSGVLACRRPDIRAFAAGGAVIYFEPRDCVHRPAAWITIGAQELIPERAQFRDYWRERAGCAPTSTPVAPAPCVAFDGCQAESPVHYCEHPGGHFWPDFGSRAAVDFFDRF